MTKAGTSHLLESVVRLTSLRDQHSLEKCLINTLQELIPASEIMLYEISGEPGRHALKLLADVPSPQPGVKKHGILPCPLEDDPDLLRCFTTGQLVVSRTEAEPGVRVIHPVPGVNGMAGLLTVKCASLIPKDQEIAASFLRIYQNYLQLINDNERDTLTDLLNRKTFDDRIMGVMSSLHSSQRRKSDKVTQYCLAILDIDHFKKINDQFGHLYGDEVLLLFAQLMTRVFRGEDQLFRYGGEEFVVLLKGVDLTMAVAVLERFRKAVASHHFPQVGNVTVSIGAVEISGQDLPTTIIGQADQALYYAKENGRNQVCAYERLLAEGKLASARQCQGDIEMF